MNQPACLEKIISVQGRGHFSQKNRTFKTFTSPSSYRSDYKDNKDPLGSNKSLVGPSNALPSKTYTKVI